MALDELKSSTLSVVESRCPLFYPIYYQWLSLPVPHGCISS